MVISIWIFARQFLENELSEPVTSRKTVDRYLLPVKKIKALKWKSEFGKVVSVVLSFPVFKGCSGLIGDITKYACFDFVW